ADVLEAEALPQPDLAEEFTEPQVPRPPGSELEIRRPLREVELQTLQLPPFEPLPAAEGGDRGLSQLPALLGGRHRLGVDAAHEREAIVEFVEGDVAKALLRALAEVVDPV